MSSTATARTQSIFLIPVGRGELQAKNMINIYLVVELLVGVSVAQWTPGGRPASTHYKNVTN